MRSKYYIDQAEVLALPHDPTNQIGVQLTNHIEDNSIIHQSEIGLINQRLGSSIRVQISLTWTVPSSGAPFTSTSTSPPPPPSPIITPTPFPPFRCMVAIMWALLVSGM